MSIQLLFTMKCVDRTIHFGIFLVTIEIQILKLVTNLMVFDTKKILVTNSSLK